MSGGTAAEQLLYLIFWGILGGGDVSGMEPAVGKGLHVFHSCSAPPLLSSTKHIAEDAPKKWIAVIPTCSHSLTAKQNLTTAYKMQFHSRGRTVQGGL